MISGAHVVVYSRNAEADRAFFRDILGFKSVDAGHGWLIFALPLTEAAFHPSEDDVHELYFLCDDQRRCSPKRRCRNSRESMTIKRLKGTRCH
jgi:catechol 2,3-dioxygenase-like lactoylglutathione lyase family enzyme